MGVLAMLGLQSRSKGAVEIINAGSDNKHLLEGLGIESLFTFIEKQGDGEDKEKWVRPEQKTDVLERAETVYSAHDTLIRVNESVNRPKFEKVVEFAKKDLDKLKDDSSSRK